MRVGEMMSREVFRVQADPPVGIAARPLCRKAIGGVPVVEGANLPEETGGR